MEICDRRKGGKGEQNYSPLPFALEGRWTEEKVSKGKRKERKRKGERGREGYNHLKEKEENEIGNSKKKTNNLILQFFVLLLKEIRRKKNR